MDKTFIIGGLSGFISQGLTWPMEYMKTTKQLPKYKNITIPNIIKTELKTNGITGFYKGITPQLISSIPRASIRFTVYEKIKKLLSNDKNELTNFNKLLCGMTAGGIEAATVMTPADVIKVTSINNNLKPLQAIKYIYSNYGLLGFYRGGGLTISRQATTQSISFMTYSNSKNIYDNNKYLKNQSSLLAGLTGGIIAVMINNPIDAIKTYKQSDRGNSNFIEIGKEIYKRKGIYGYYNGMLLRICRVAPLHGITFLTYDLLKN